MPFFSVIIPLYNKEDFIENTLQSVISQTFIDFEIIVVNDGSIDGGETKVLSFKDSRIKYFHKTNGGVSSARNFGIERSSSNYICFLDADDYWYPDFLEQFYKTISKYPEQKVFSCSIEIEAKKRTFPAQYSIKKTSSVQIINYFQGSLKQSIIWTSCVIIHKNVFKNIGVFDTNIKYGEDTDLWIRIGLKYDIVFIWKILAKYVLDNHSISRRENYIYSIKDINKFSKEEENNHYLKKYMDYNRFTAAVKNKIINRKKDFNLLYQQISFKNIGLKKTILLLLPAYCLRILIQIKNFNSNIGIGKSIFK